MVSDEPEVPEPSQLQKMLNAQRELQIEAYGKDPTLLNGDERADFIRWNMLALNNEILGEALDETGWKPWATSRHINQQAFHGEMVDGWHFFMNLMLVSGMTADDLERGYYLKRAKNAKRQVDGYDGVAGKCRKCKRALDDDAVQCWEMGDAWACLDEMVGGRE